MKLFSIFSICIALVFGLLLHTNAGDSFLPTKDGKKTQTLFTIERSMNKNIVKYDAQFIENGKIDPKKPIDIYWIMENSGEREELNFFERKAAYGIVVSEINEEQNAMDFVVNAVKKKKMKLLLDKEGRAYTQIIIDGKISKLTKVYVKAHPKKILKVLYIDFFGVDAKTGKAVYEKYFP